jgi:hypothetical protein
MLIKLLISILVASTCFVEINCREVCFDKLGCFKDAPFGFLPNNLEEINTIFTLYTREIPSGIRFNSESIRILDYDTNLKTKIIINDFKKQDNSNYVDQLKDNLIRQQASNVIVVNWSGSTMYLKAAANTMVVGKQIAQIVNHLVNDKGARSSNFHIIGFGLGAHIAGQAGKNIVKLERISGLDPVGMFFEDTDPQYRLTKDDAYFVDVIHTDTVILSQIGLGIKKPIGDVDFYPNGGQNQPNCKCKLCFVCFIKLIYSTIIFF